MKILLSSHFFPPSTGGIETMSLLLAEEFTRRGHAVRVITQSAANGPDPADWGFEVVRKPSSSELIAGLRWCDLCFHNNISLQTVWPLLVGLVQRPLVVTHQTWLYPLDAGPNRGTGLKRWALGGARASISISKAIEEHVALPARVPSHLIGNAYDDSLFRELPDAERTTELCFLGRLVSDKGADLLLEALQNLRERGLTPSLTIIGDGKERSALEKQVQDLGLTQQVQFVGKKSGEELVRLLNAHRIMVAPARWKEPFGIVALEGIACGCVVVGSEGGGLADAIGPCGVTFPNGDAAALTAALERLLRGGETELARFRSRAPEHLGRHTLGSITSRYLAVFEDALKGRGATHSADSSRGDTSPAAVAGGIKPGEIVK